MSQIHFCNDGTHTFTDRGTTPEGYASVCINNGGEKISTTPIPPQIIPNTQTFRVLEDISVDVGKCLEWENVGRGVRGPDCLVKEKKFVQLRAGDIIRTNGFHKNSQGELMSIKIPYGNNGESISISFDDKYGSPEKFQLLKENYLTKKQLQGITNDLEITKNDVDVPDVSTEPKPTTTTTILNTQTAGLGSSKIAMILIVGGFIYYAYSKGLLKK